MGLILNIETSTTNCSVALSQNKDVLFVQEEADQGYSHGEKLHLFIKQVFKETGVSLNALDAIAVSKGPGSYTGLRIGVSAAKGLCYALDRPLIATSTLEAQARQVSTQNKAFIISILDARRMEVYAAIYDENYKEVRGIKAEVLRENIYDEYSLPESSLFVVGNAVEKTSTILNRSNVAISYVNTLPSAREMAHMANLKYQINEVEDVAYFEPYYLKDFIAIKPKPLF